MYKCVHLQNQGGLAHVVRRLCLTGAYTRMRSVLQRPRCVHRCWHCSLDLDDYKNDSSITLHRLDSLLVLTCVYSPYSSDGGANSST